MRSATSSARSSARSAGRRQRRLSRRRSRYNLELGLEEAARGTEAKIRIPTLEACATCHGSGAKPGTQPKQCATCHGRGEVRVSQGFFLDPADVSDLSRHRQGGERPLHGVPRPGAHEESTRRCR
jgi:DnaJ-class molecular chaperone